MKSGISTILINVLFVFSSFGQISYGGKPIPLSIQDLSDVPVINLECIEKEKPGRKEEGSSRLKINTNSIICDVYQNVTEAGKLAVLKDGTRVWRIGLHSKYAESLNIVFSKYQLAEGVKVFVFDEHQNKILGAFTNKNNKTFNKLAISPVHSDLIYIEVQALKFVKDIGELEIGYVAKKSDSKNENRLKDKYFGTSGECNVDVNCYNNAGIQQQKYSVVRIIYDGEERCTGTLINNTRENGHPYILTAGHCISRQSTANSSIFFFNYESPACMGTDGSTELSVSGAKIVASTPCIEISENETDCFLDFTLLELSEEPPFYYHPYFSGWDKSNNAPVSSYTIHHPLGDVKKISFEDHQAVTGDYGEGFDVNTHWQVMHWEIGTTEPGSSGAGLFNENNRLVGTLTGGDAYCGYSYNDFFEKLYHTWADYAEPKKQLEYWLDPLFKNTDFIDGYDPYKYLWISGDTLSNIKESELLGIIPVFPNGTATGHSSDSVKLFAEHFSSFGEKKIIAVYLNVAFAFANYDTSKIIMHIYQGGDKPGNILFSKKINLFDLIQGLNFIPLDTILPVVNDFFIGYEIVYNNDLFAVNMALEAQEFNSAFLYYNNEWIGMNKYPPVGFASSLDIRPIVFDTTPKPHVNDLDFKEIKIKPNPAIDYVNFRFWEMPKTDVTIKFYNISGQVVHIERLRRPDIETRLELKNFQPGMYIINININNFNIQRKLLIISK